jgi:hypothetical protein
MPQVCLKSLRIASIATVFLSQLLRLGELVVVIGQLILMSMSQIFGYENAGPQVDPLERSG